MHNIAKVLLLHNGRRACMKPRNLTYGPLSLNPKGNHCQSCFRLLLVLLHCPFVEDILEFTTYNQACSSAVVHFRLQLTYKKCLLFSTPSVYQVHTDPLCRTSSLLGGTNKADLGRGLCCADLALQSCSIHSHGGSSKNQQGSKACCSCLCNALGLMLLSHHMQSQA